MKVIIDGHSIFFKVYFWLFNQKLTNKEGVKTWAIYGFINYLNSLKREYWYKNNDFIITFDNKTSKKIRKKFYPEYKEWRLDKDPDLYNQLNILMGLLKAEWLIVLSLPYLEADDLCYNLANYYSAIWEEVIIVSRDHDLLQGLQFSNVKFLLDSTKSKKILTKEDFKSLYSFNIRYFLAYKALLGDSSDNVKGVPKIGEKTAKKIINCLEENNITLKDYLKLEKKDLEEKKGVNCLWDIGVKLKEKIDESKEIIIRNVKLFKPLEVEIKEEYLKRNKNEEEANNIYLWLDIKKRLTNGEDKKEEIKKEFTI